MLIKQIYCGKAWGGGGWRTGERRGIFPFLLTLSLLITGVGRHRGNRDIVFSFFFFTYWTWIYLSFSVFCFSKHSCLQVFLLFFSSLFSRSSMQRSRNFPFSFTLFLCKAVILPVFFHISLMQRIQSFPFSSTLALCKKVTLSRFLYISLIQRGQCFSYVFVRKAKPFPVLLIYRSLRFPIFSNQPKSVVAARDF